MANKNSKYVQSLVSFILDTKPYHSKLTDVVEEYRFSDEMTVHFDERLFTNTTTKAAWLYSHFADGVSIPSPKTKIHRLISPLFRQFPMNSDPANNRGAFKVGRDENTDLPLVPFAFDPKSIQGTGLADAFVQRNGLGTKNEALLEGHDVFLSHGAYVFQIKQTISTQPAIIGRFTQEFTQYAAPDFTELVVYPQTVTMPFTASTMVVTGPAVQTSSTSIQVNGAGLVNVFGLSDQPNYDPQFTERSNENLLATVTSVAQVQALDKSNPSSAISLVQVVLDIIAGVLSAEPNTNAFAELAVVQNALDNDVLPSSYEELISSLYSAGVNVPAGTALNIGSGRTKLVSNWGEVHDVLNSYSTSLYFNEYTDLSIRESGALAYDDLYLPNLIVKNIKANPFRPDYEEWTLIAASETSFFVKGSISGVVGAATLPGSFSSSYISFDLEATNGIIIIEGEEFVLTPTTKVVVHATAPLEAWSVIKVNPQAYTRPVFSSTRYGYVMDATGVHDYITIVDQSVPTCTLVLTALSSTTFSVTDTSEPTYYAEANVNEFFDDGRFQFTIVSGTHYTYQAGDKFFIEIENNAPVADDLDLYYGFDLDAFDGNEIIYNTVNAALADYQTELGFAFDSRFVNFDWVAFNLQISQNIVSGNQWRLRAVPNVSKPLLLQNSTPSNLVNEIAVDDPLNPNAASQFDMPNSVTEGVQTASDPDNVADIQLWYADSFALEYFDESLGIWVTADTVPVGSTYNGHGFSFNLIEASKPYISARVRSSWAVPGSGVVQSETVEGGDLFYWVIRNDPPVQQEPSCLESIRIPRLVMHGDSYHFTVPAKWYLNFTSATTYSLQGYYTTGDLNGYQVLSEPLQIDLSDGYSYHNESLSLHWTVIGASGFGVGDQFTFETFEKKPIFLVHGSVSGWQESAEIDKYYWNGKIGFKIRSPKVELFENGLLVKDWVSSHGLVTVTKLRYDTTSAVYRVYAHNDGYWTLYRDGAIVGAGETSVSDKFISLNLPTVIQGAALTIHVTADEMDFSMGQDLAIVRTTPGRAPRTDDFVLFSRTREDSISISVKAKDSNHAIDLSVLGPTNIDLRYINHTTGSGVPLSVTSPETSVLSGWLPALTVKRDNGTSLADFSDSAVTHEVYSATIGEKIGSVHQLSGSTDYVFEWDSTFAENYLPINTEASIVTYGSGMNESVRVNITEGIQFLLSGGGTSDSAMFNDPVNVAISEQYVLKLKSSYNTDVTVNVDDSPFGGFLPGFDTARYDLEDGVNGYFDAGQAFTGMFERARVLDLQNVLSPTEQAEYNDLIGLLAPYLTDDSGVITSPGQMSLTQFIDLLEQDPPINYTPQYFGFGIPAVGMAMEITDYHGGKPYGGVDPENVEGAGALIEEALTIRSYDFGYAYDQSGFDAGGFDVPSDSTVTVYSASLPPVPNTGIPSGAYADFETPLTVPAPGGRVIEITFAHVVGSTPQFYVWKPTDPAPQVISVVERVSDTLFRFSMPSVTELKLIVV